MKDIVYVDDDPTAFLSQGTALQTSRIEDFDFVPTDFGDEAYEAGKAATLWLFDFFLVDGGDVHRDENGLSLFQKWKATIGGRPTTVLISSDLKKAVGEPLGPPERHHVVAQRQGVEWIGDKSAKTLERVIALADAGSAIIRTLGADAGADPVNYNAERLAFDVLRVPRDADWAASAVRQIDRARPPRELSAPTGPAAARTIIGWLLAHVIPYPSFLLTDAQAALRLGIYPACFRALAEQLDDKSKRGLRKPLGACRYTGPLPQFLGQRWWRAAIDDLAWQLSQTKDGYRSALEKMANGIELAWLEQSDPVLIFSPDLVETDDVAEANDCVRVTDEDFPADVDPAWVTIASANENRQLRAKVVFEDRDVLSAAG